MCLGKPVRISKPCSSPERIDHVLFFFFFPNYTSPLQMSTQSGQTSQAAKQRNDKYHTSINLCKTAILFTIMHENI